MLGWSLLTGPLPIALRALAAAAVVWLLGSWRFRRRVSLRSQMTIIVVCGLLAALGVVTAGYLARERWMLFPDRLPAPLYAWAAIAAAAISSALVLITVDRHAGRAVLDVGAALMIAVTCGNQINIAFAAYPSLREVLGLGDPHEVPLTELRVPNAGPPVPLHGRWTAPPGMPEHGTLTSLPIPGRVSGFTARDAEIYLPPAVFTDQRPRLPVVVLLAGQPGTPHDWVGAGHLASTMDTYAAAHAGLAPIVVVADGTGTEFGNPLCLDSRRGNAATYLTVDVPTAVKASLPVDPATRAWAVGGLSYGGTCALQLATTHPETYPTFLDISGQAEPSLGNRRRTVEQAFGGDENAFARVNPLDVLRTRRYNASAGAILVGASDHDTLDDARAVYTATRAAGMNTHYSEIPGGHDWRAWSGGYARELPWLSTRLGLP